MVTWTKAIKLDLYINGLFKKTSTKLEHKKVLPNTEKHFVFGKESLLSQSNISSSLVWRKHSGLPSRRSGFDSPDVQDKFIAN